MKIYNLKIHNLTKTIILFGMIHSFQSWAGPTPKDSTKIDMTEPTRVRHNTDTDEDSNHEKEEDNFDALPNKASQKTMDDIEKDLLMIHEGIPKILEQISTKTPTTTKAVVALYSTISGSIKDFINTYKKLSEYMELEDKKNFEKNILNLIQELNDIFDVLSYYDQATLTGIFKNFGAALGGVSLGEQHAAKYKQLQNTEDSLHKISQERDKEKFNFTLQFVPKNAAKQNLKPIYKQLNPHEASSKYYKVAHIISHSQNMQNAGLYSIPLSTILVPLTISFVLSCIAFACGYFIHK